MQCPKCGHSVANGRPQCMYCGAALGGGASTDGPDVLHKGVGKDQTSWVVTEQHEVFDKLDDVPEDWRKDIEEAIKQGGGHVREVFGTQEQDMWSVFSGPRTQRRARMHPLILALIFFVSAGVVGIVLWLMM